MQDISLKKRIRGWMMFDWASQPYHTLILTFIFGPYFAEQMIAQLIGSGVDPEQAKADAQSLWGVGIMVSGLLIALLAPILGAVADGTGRRLPWIWVFSVAYVIGASGLWIASPSDFPAYTVLAFFILGVVGVEFTTVFTNAMLPSLGTKDEIGAVSGSGWAWGYVGGAIALVIMLLVFAESSNGVTLLGNAPALGLDPVEREGTRFVGPFTALWFAISMIPFALWVREPNVKGLPVGVAIRTGMTSLKQTLISLPSRTSFFSYLISSMFYRDALNGIFAFGGVYALGVLGWSVTQVGIFGILGIISGAIFTFIGGKMDAKYGPKPVIRFCIIVLILTSIAIVTISRESVFGISVGSESSLPDLTFNLCGIVLGAVAGVIQSASRTMIVKQADPERMTEAFGLFALSGKATAFMAPALIALTTALTGSQRLGITPIIGLFLIGLILLAWVKPEGDEG